jgi:hypothetical protein
MEASDRSEPLEESVRRRLVMGAKQELSRARADLEVALEAPVPGHELTLRLDEVARDVAELHRATNVLTRNRDRRRELALLLSQRLLLDQLGFGSYEDYAAWTSANPHRDPNEGDDDPAYAEFAQLRLDLAEERLAAIEVGQLDLRGVGAFDGAPSGVDHDPLVAWTNPAWSRAGLTDHPASARAPTRTLPKANVTDLRTLDLPYWSEPA